MKAEIKCKGCNKSRLILKLRESFDNYLKRRPFCVACGHKNRIRKLGGHAPNWNGGRHISSKGYVRVWVGPGSKYEFEHQRIWRENIGEIPKGHVIHHKDGDKLNNKINNLECITKEVHDKMSPSIKYAWKYRWGYLTNKNA